jgi:hypothetical protein
MNRMRFLLQQNPIVVELAPQPEPAPDITFEVILGMFAAAGWLLLAAAIGSGLVAAGVILYKRWRDASAPMGEAPHSHTRLHI